jgi:hypothetical protein
MPPMTKKKVKPEQLALTDAEKKLQAARYEGWMNPTFVGDVLCCVQPMAVTWGLIVGIDPYNLGESYLRRYCFEHREDAMAALRSFEDPLHRHAPGPWVKCKGMWGNEYVDLLNPELFTLDASTGLMKRKQESQDEQASETA